MDPAERLAEYLAGELPPGEAAAVEAELARDADLRAQLSAMNSADAALAGLSSPRPSIGFKDRLDDFLAAEFATLRPAPLAGDIAPVDELARRRAQRTGMPRWVTALSGAAAIMILAAGAGLVFTDFLGGSADQDDIAALDAADDEARVDGDDSDGDAGGDTGLMDSFAVPEGGRDNGARESGDAPASESAQAPFIGPQLISQDREFDEQSLGALLDDPLLVDFADRALPASEALRVAETHLDAIHRLAVEAPIQDGPEPVDGAESDGRTDDQQSGTSDPGVVGQLSLADRDAVRNCLDGLASALIVWIEFGSADGREVLVIGAVEESSSTGTFDQPTVHVVDRETCTIGRTLQP